MANWLVTGGCGFIGSHLVEALVARGDRVRILDDLSTGHRQHAVAGTELVVGCITNAELVASAMRGVDGCFHLAAVASVERGRTEWLYTHRVNLTGTIAVYEAARQARDGAPVPVVYASSAAVYGDNPNIPLTEDEHPIPLSAYGADKLGCELHGRVAWHIHRVPNVGLRFFNVYGPRQDPRSPYSGVISIFVDRLRAGRGIDIHGDGSQIRDFIFVKDVVRHLLAAMSKATADNHVFNVCTGQGTSIMALAQAIGRALGREPEISRQPPRQGDIKMSLGNPAKAARFLEVAAATALDHGL
ncbi:MAG TPA: NAD-dependent epimerase/dehydratase family protein, partial [Alphaproteobacteria bacterium]|nr:NAD-dependent epimerase/dehydratase family protein [Alphaproteobacteria bacterium]